MPIRLRHGNNPARRLMQEGTYDHAALQALTGRVTYVGSANHKLKPGNYGFVPPVNPRASKSPCDDRRSVLIEEARSLLEIGIGLGMVSAFEGDGVPKYVWTVDADGEVYEAKTKPGQERCYHGYRLGEDDRAMRELIREEWKRRCL